MDRRVEIKKKLSAFFGSKLEAWLLVLIRFLEKTVLKNIRYYIFKKVNPYWGAIVIPMKEAIHPSVEVTTTQEIIEIAKRCDIKGAFPCFCKSSVYRDPNCKAPVNTCLIMGNGKYIKQLEKTKDFTPISFREIEETIRKADEYGLVHQLIYFPGPDYYYVICNCCECCCAVISTYKRFANHIKTHGDQIFLIKPSDFIAKVDLGKCQGCGICLSRCKFFAIKIEYHKSVTLEAFCKGCGLCATGCPNNARHLFLRKKERVN